MPNTVGDEDVQVLLPGRLADGRKSLTQVCYEMIRDSILQGRVAPGTQLKQNHLAQQLGASQRTVREALARLVSVGLAVHEPRKGVRTASADMQELEDICFIRFSVEPRAVELAASQIGREALLRMEELLPLASGTAQQEDGKLMSVKDANRLFHWEAIRASGRRQLIRTLDQVWDLSLVYSIRETVTPDEMRAANRDDLRIHSELLEALTAHDSARARSITEQHIATSLKRLMARWAVLRMGPVDHEITQRPGVHPQSESQSGR